MLSFFVSWRNKYAIIEWPLFDAPKSTHGVFTSFSLSRCYCLHFCRNKFGLMFAQGYFKGQRSSIIHKLQLFMTLCDMQSRGNYSMRHQVPMVSLLKNSCNFTDPVMGIAIRKVQGTVNLRESARTFYILTANLLFFCRFSVNSRAIDRILQDLRYIPRKICCREMTRFFKLRGISRQQIFRGICRKSPKIRSIARKFTENLQKNRKLAVNI